jgi:cohesin complex subunit SCC1
LLLPDTITELDLFAPLPDLDDFLAGNDARAPGQDPTLLDFGMSQILDSQTPARRQEKRLLQLDDDDLGLEIGFDDDDNFMRSPRMSEGPSIEIGRRAQSIRPDQPSLLEDDLGLELGMDDDTLGPDTTLRPMTPAMLEEDVQMGGMDDEIAAANAAALARADAAQRRQRGSESPLSSVRSSVERDLEETFQLHSTNMQLEEEDPTLIQAAQRVKRRKVLTMDAETELNTDEIRLQQSDRSAITKAPTFLPRDPLLLQLMEMQRNGTFVSNLLGDGYLQGWAPELRGILSLEIIRKAGDKKRKRDSGIADVGTDEEVEVNNEAHQSSPQLDIPQDEDDFGHGAPTPAPMFSNDLDDDVEPLEDSYNAGNANFDITEAPLLHPSQSGPVALGTKKMVHVLREHFAPTHTSSTLVPPTPSKRTKNSALFTDLCPEASTSRDMATKMFFELLVLGTKDAIKVEQDNRSSLGGPMRVRGKRGLWGDWAEMSNALDATQTQPAALPSVLEQNEEVAVA